MTTDLAGLDQATQNVADLARTMRRLAIEAGAVTLAHFRRDGLTAELKADASPVTVADRAADRVIVDGLRGAAPHIALVTEEQSETHDQQLAPDGRFFLIDPLDGTKEFVSGSGEYTVNIALIEAGAPVLGVVYAPALGRLFWTPDPASACEEQGAFAPDEEQGAFAPNAIGETKPLMVRQADPAALSVVASRSHRGAATDAYIAKRAIASVASAGSSLKFCLIAAGEADLYPRLGRTMEWDTAAAHAVLRAAGGAVVRYDNGAPLLYGKAGFENPFFVAHGAGVAREIAIDAPDAGS